EREADVVEPVQESVPRRPVHLERELLARRPDEHAALEVDGHGRAAVEVDALHQPLHVRLVELHGEHPDLAGVRAEDVAEGRRDHDVEAVVLERPRGVLARRAAAEVAAGEQDLGAGELGPVQLAAGARLSLLVVAPVEEEELAVAGALDPLQELLGDDLVGVDVRTVEHRHPAADDAQRLHAGTASSSRTSTKRPAIAAAAAMAGLTRCVRPRRPWRPSKLRFDVDAQRSPGCSTSGFMPRHIEQPAFRHSNPARRKISSSPSSSAWRLTAAEPGTTSAFTRGATRLPSTTRAAMRRSSMRAFVHEPMKTRSIVISRIGVPGRSPMYSSARSAAARSSGSGKSDGSGTTPPTGTTMPGFVPQVTCGSSADSSTSSTRS